MDKVALKKEVAKSALLLKPTPGLTPVQIVYGASLSVNEHRREVAAMFVDIDDAIDFVHNSGEWWRSAPMDVEPIHIEPMYLY